jgi:hypothetical protein
MTLAKGAKLRFDLATKGRETDWETPTADIKKQGNVIYLELDTGKVLIAKAVDVANSISPQFEFTLTEEVSAGSNIIINVGIAPNSTDAKGNTSQKITQRRRPFYLHVDAEGRGKFDTTETFYLDIRGGKLEFLKILTPSFVVRNKRFDVIIRFEDSYGNLTNKAPDETLIEVSYENFRENLNWKLFVPETGFLTLPNLYFNEIGVYRIQLKNLLTNQVYYSQPIKCFADNSSGLYWGLLHGESEKVDSLDNTENYLRHFRDEKAFNYTGVSPFESIEETSNEAWKSINHSVSEFSEEDRFISFLGFQYPGEQLSEGLRLFTYRKDNKSILRQKDQKTNNLKKIYKSTLPKEMIAIPCFTMGGNNLGFDFEDFTPEFERVVEIYNAWGSSECLEEEGNPRPIASSKKGYTPFAKGSIRSALNRNRRFGFIAGGLDDRGIYSEFYDNNQVQYTPGLTGIISEKHTREALFEALYARSCYATTGERIILGFAIAGSPMGSELDTGSKPGLSINRHISGYVAGTTEITTVEIIRNGKVIKTYAPKSPYFDFTYDDMDPLQTIALNAEDESPPFVYYYLRVTQKDQHMAWSSPIWVDYLAKSTNNIAGKKAKKVNSVNF